MITTIKSYLIWGYYGYGNLGDNLMLKIIVDKILQKCPRSRIFVRCYDTPDNNNIIPFPIEKIEIPSRFLKAAVYCIRLFKAMFHIDIFVIGGGTLFLDKGRHSFSMLFMALAVFFAKLMKKRIYLVGVGMDILTFPQNMIYLRYILKNCDCAYLRDNFSYTMASYLTKKDNVFRTSDIVFDNSFVTSLTKDCRTTSSHIAVSLTDYFKTYPSSKKRQLLARQSYNIIEMLTEKYSDNYIILLCAFQNTPGESDYEYLAEIKNSITEKNKRYTNRIMLKHIVTESQIRDTFGSAVFTLGMRYHALVLSAIFKKPFLGINVEVKIKEFCIEFGMPFLNIEEYLTHGISFSDTENLLKSVISNEILQKQIEMATANFSWIP